MNKLSISFRESTAIKGFLIILIILGHAQPLIQISGVLRSFFYDFHVHCFMILPLLYPVKQLSRERVKNYFARLIIPYILLFVIFYIGRYVPLLIMRNQSNGLTFYEVINLIIEGSKSMVMGGYFPLGDSIKIRYLWFLPVMFSFVIIKDYYFTILSKKQKTAVLLLGGIFYSILWVCLYPPFFIEEKREIMYYSPLSIWQAIGALFMGVITMYALRITYSSKLRMIMKIALPIIFIIIYRLYTFFPKTSEYLLPLKTVIPIIAFMLLFFYKEVFSKSIILRRFGEQSFEIYIIQTPICVLMYTFLPKLIPNNSIMVRLLSFILVLTICYYTAKIMSNIRIVKRFFFPRTWEELMGRSR